MPLEVPFVSFLYFIQKLFEFFLKQVTDPLLLPILPYLTRLRVVHQGEP